MRYLLLALALLCLPGVASAQIGREKCGTLEHAEDELSDLARYFTNPEYAEVREGLFEQVSPDAPREVVRDPRVCNRVMHAAIRTLREHHNNWKELRRNGFDFTVLRYGPYYAVVVFERPPPDVKIIGGWAEMLVFRASDLQFLGGVLV